LKTFNKIINGDPATTNRKTPTLATNNKVRASNGKKIAIANQAFINVSIHIAHTPLSVECSEI